MSRIVIYGTGGMAQVLHALLQDDSTRNVIAFTVERQYISAETLFGLPVFPFEDIVSHCPPEGCAMLVAVGQVDRNRVRARISAAARGLGYEIASYIDPLVRRHASTRIGQGCLIFDGVSLQPHVTIGDNVVIRPLAYIGHHARIEDYCFIAPHATLLGFCRIGAFSFIGAHATISNRVALGERGIVGAGAVVLANIPADRVVRGPGATKIK
ncbi:MAG: acetyltransferase [Alphaproteobacteria bacterium]